MNVRESIQRLMTPTLAAITGTLFLSAFLLYQWLLPKPIPGIPFNDEALKTIWGDIPSMLNHLKTHKTLMDWMQGHLDRHNSPIVQVFANLFRRPWIAISDYRETQDILMRRTKEFDKPDMISDIFYGLAPDHHTVKETNDEWRYQRKLMQDLMTPSFLNGVAGPQLHANFMDLVKLWSEKQRLSQGHPFVVRQDIYETALEAIWAAVFGIEDMATVTRSQIELLTTLKSINIPAADKAVELPRAPAPASFHAVIEITDGIEHIVKSPWPRVTGFIRRYIPSVRRHLKLMDRIIHDEISKAEHRMKASSGTSDKITNAVDHMLRREKTASEKAHRPPNYHSKEMAAELFGLLIAGHDTTSTTLLWSIKHLSASQSVQSRLRTELHTIYPSARTESRAPTAHEIATTPSHYLDACIEELIRVAGTPGAITRTAKTDVTVLGCVIPKGTRVVFFTSAGGVSVPPFSIPDHLRSESYRKAEGGKVGDWEKDTIGDFIPERWMVDGKDGKVFDASAGPHIMFGAGPRGCFGRKLAYLEMRLALVLVLWHFELLEVEGEYASWEAIDQLTHNPLHAYVRLKAI